MNNNNNNNNNGAMDNSTVDSTDNMNTDGITTNSTNQAMNMTAVPNTTNTMLNVDANKEEIMTFVNDDAINIVSKDADFDVTKKSGQYSDNDIGGFFDRPIKGGYFTWTVGAPFFQVINPWQTFFSNPQVQAKLKNYFLARCDLKVLFQVNGTPFHYGLLLVSYDPYDKGARGTQLVGGNTDEINLMRHSQLPHGYINPTTNTPLQLNIPFHANKDWFKIDTYDANEVNLGNITMQNISTTLSVATTAASTSVTITWFVMADNMELSIPTSTDILAEAGDEYDETGIISGPAQVVANIANKLTTVPLIGKLATSTSIVATSIGNIAKVFGFSKPVQTIDPIPIKNNPLHNMANTVAKDMSNKLTFDMKQETTVDTSVAGIASADHMTIAHIAGTETYVTKFSWSQGSAIDSTLFMMNVCPIYSSVGSSVAITNQLQLSSLSFASLPFRYWSGTIIYRIVVVASAYHKGRLKVSYEPNGGAIPSGSEYNTSYSHIFDLSEGCDFEFGVSWAQDIAYKEVGDPRIQNYGPIYNYNSVEQNGMFYVSVLNELTAPLNTADIEVLVYARAGSDFELFNPRSDADGFGVKDLIVGYGGGPDFQLNVDEDDSLIAEGDEGVISLVGAADSEIYKNKGVVYHGDPVVSFRQLLKRAQFAGAIASPTFSTSVNGRIPFAYFFRHIYPVFGGTKADNYNTFNNVSDAFNTSLIAYTMGSYMGYRGGMRWKYVPFNNSDTPGYISCERVTRNSSNYVGAWGVTSAISTSDPYNTTATFGLAGNTINMFSGTHATYSENQGAIEVEYPYYSKFRFCFTGSYGLPSGSELDDTDIMLQKIMVLPRENHDATATSLGRTFNLMSFVSTAEDFNLIWYLGPPTYSYAI